MPGGSRRADRVTAGLSDAVGVIEAQEKSGGALITVCHALDARWDVWGVLGPLGLPEGHGSNMLFADGARVLWGTPDFQEAVMGLTKDEGGAIPPGP